MQRSKREQHTGDATRHGDLAGGYASVPTVFLQHTRVSRGGSVHEQKDPKVRGGIGIANPSGSIVLSYGPRHPATPFPRRSSEQDHNTSKKLLDPPIESLRSLNTGTSSPWQKPTTATTGHCEKYFSGYSPPTTILSFPILIHTLLSADLSTERSAIYLSVTYPQSHSNRLYVTQLLC
jgi:hypothetical protein